MEWRTQGAREGGEVGREELEVERLRGKQRREEGSGRV